MSNMQYGPRRPVYYGAYGNTGDDRSEAPLTEAEARGLAGKYNVSRLSRNDYSLLLRDLRSAGYITSQEFSAGYGGTLPRSVPEPLEPFPLGENTGDFVALLEQYVQYCVEVLKGAAGGSHEQAHTQSLLDTYSRLCALFKQIQNAASRSDEV